MNHYEGAATDCSLLTVAVILYSLVGHSKGSMGLLDPDPAAEL